MRIRRAAAEDADTLSDLAHRAKSHWGYPASWMREWDAQLTIIPGYLELHDVFVAEENGAIVGMCALEDQHVRWHLEHELTVVVAHDVHARFALANERHDEAGKRRPGLLVGDAPRHG